MTALRAALEHLARRPGRAFLVLFALSLSIQGFVLSKLPWSAKTSSAALLLTF